MKNIFIFLSFIISSFPVFGQLEVKTNNRPDGITLKYINPIPVAITPDYEAGLSLYKYPANNVYTVAITVLFKSSVPEELQGNLLIQTTENNGISLKPVMNKLFNMDGREVATSMYILTNRDIRELSINPIKMISFNVNNETITLHLTENEDLLTKEFILLNGNQINKNENQNSVSKSNSSSFTTFIIIFFILVLITCFIVLNKKTPEIIENIETTIVETDNSPKEDSKINQIKRIGYKPSLQFKQAEPYNYPVVKMPKEDCIIKFPKKGRTNRLGYTERSFFNQLNLYFSSDFKVYNDRHILHKNNYTAYEPDFLLINKKSEKNIYINIEIDEPYDGISRVPTHELNSDVYRDLFFINRGYIVIRFTEKQIFEESKECCAFISNVIKSIDSNYINNDLNYSSRITIYKQWDSLQSKEWALEKFRETYLGIKKFTNHSITSNKINYINSELDDLIESSIVEDKPSNINTDDNKPLNGNKSHPRDKRIAFDPINHRYFIDNNPDTISVSQLIDKFFPEFDAIRAAQNLNPNNELYGLPVDTIVEIWKKKGIEAAELGTHLHKQIENYYKLIPYDASSIEIQYFLNFKEQYRNMTPHRTEWRIFDEAFLLAGTVDMVYKREDGAYYIFDWKRSGKVVNADGTLKTSDPNHFYTKFAYGGLNHLTDDSYYKYALQLNVYRHILERKYGYIISSMNLLILHPEYSTYHLVTIPTMKDEVDYIFSTLKTIS